MTIQDAIESGKQFRRSKGKVWFIPTRLSFFGKSSILATDWEVLICEEHTYTTASVHALRHKDDINCNACYRLKKSKESSDLVIVGSSEPSEATDKEPMILTAFKQGKKIRHIHWAVGSYLRTCCGVAQWDSGIVSHLSQNEWYALLIRNSGNYILYNDDSATPSQVTQQGQTCNCDIQLLLQRGCQCNGI